MISSISAVVPPPPPTSNPAPLRPSPQTSSNGPSEDTVQLSSTATKVLTAKPAEALETPAQTQAEAASGDPIAAAKLEARQLQ